MATGEVTEPAGTQKDFFISYNRADRAWAEWIAWQLEEAGYTTVLQAWDFRPGGNFVLEMDRAAREARHTIAVLSQDYLDALYTHPEWAAAFARDPVGAERMLVPTRVRECTLKGLLSQVIYIDLVGAEETTAQKMLLDGVSGKRQKPVTRPGFPGSAPQFPGGLSDEKERKNISKFTTVERAKRESTNRQADINRISA